MTLLAVAASGPSGSTLSDVEPGALGFLVVAGLGLALFFLLRSMNKHLRKVAAMAEAEAESAAREAAEPQDTAPAGAADAAGPADRESDTVRTGNTVQTGNAKQDDAANHG